MNVDKSDANKGVYRKFRVERTDGSSGFGGRHEHCQYFVLDCQHDPFARAALNAYADACESQYPLLARDARRMAEGQRIFLRYQETVR